MATGGRLGDRSSKGDKELKKAVLSAEKVVRRGEFLEEGSVGYAVVVLGWAVALGEPESGWETAGDEGFAACQCCTGLACLSKWFVG